MAAENLPGNRQIAASHKETEPAAKYLGSTTVVDPKEMGAGIAASPHLAPSEGSAGVRNLVDRSRSLTNPLSILAHQLRRRFPSDRSLARRSLTDLRMTTRRIANLSTDPACLEPKLPAKAVRCSTALLGSTPLASRFALHAETLRAASRLRKINSSGASYRLTPHPLRRASATPAGGDRTFGHLPLPSCPCGPPGEAGTAVPIT